MPGIGPWTAAEVAVRALGDPDAVSVGDYHLPSAVVFAFTGRRRGTDGAELHHRPRRRVHRIGQAVHGLEDCSFAMADLVASQRRQ